MEFRHVRRSSPSSSSSKGVDGSSQNENRLEGRIHDSLFPAGIRSVNLFNDHEPVHLADWGKLLGCRNGIEIRFNLAGKNFVIRT